MDGLVGYSPARSESSLRLGSDWTAVSVLVVDTFLRLIWVLAWRLDLALDTL